MGNVLAPGGGATEFRAASLVAGFPETTAVRATNRQCSSGLQAVVDIANAIRCGMIEVGIGAGVESMSSQYGPGAVTEFSELVCILQQARDTGVKELLMTYIARLPPRIQELQSTHGRSIRANGQRSPHLPH